MTNGNSLKVFISYASADHEYAQKLYAHLLGLGVKPWIDTEDLLPGQEWKMAISQALEKTDLVLLCLSRNSVSKEGYVQKEMRLALDRALEMPPGEVFLIPCRFEECELPYSLREYQVVDLFAENGLRRLGKSLAARAHKIGAFPPSTESADGFEKPKAASRRQVEDHKNTSNIEIHIHGDVTGSNLVLGDGNEVQLLPKDDS